MLVIDDGGEKILRDVARGLRALEVSLEYAMIRIASCSASAKTTTDEGPTTDDEPPSAFVFGLSSFGVPVLQAHAANATRGISARS